MQKHRNFQLQPIHYWHSLHLWLYVEYTLESTQHWPGPSNWFWHQNIVPTCLVLYLCVHGGDICLEHHYMAQAKWMEKITEASFHETFRPKLITFVLYSNYLLCQSLIKKYLLNIQFDYWAVMIEKVSKSGLSTHGWLSGPVLFCIVSCGK